ncbi:uncharacterized protein BJ212DRAFT_832028 [Suillus subaureus]|uniref:Uncharacterized protein n=1 Tax=Suillus subaureus TaxID=48587 RepID=A0A9P7EJP4_9AGAM|nr:uncharacterized protein BJ212DRAFT_832028 [Suillus subaureus]KAG1822846.1 hypothetical protein BJ212DRAFT_832028 [Suillus subaureus]
MHIQISVSLHSGAHVRIVPSVYLRRSRKGVNPSRDESPEAETSDPLVPQPSEEHHLVQSCSVPAATALSCFRSNSESDG